MELNRRVVIAGALLATLVVSSLALATMREARDGADGTFALTVVAPDGEFIFDGAVTVENATALSVLQAASLVAGFTLELEDYGGMGTYVRAIGGHRADGASGWVYEIRGPDGDWSSGDRSAAFRPLSTGESVRWSWTASGG